MLCADGACRATFVHCYRALANATRPGSASGAPSGAAPDLLADALPDCASAERRRNLEEGLAHAAELLEALASFAALRREVFE